jgi:DNA invertase Pin-like site-specific DNA recombinase
MDGIKKAKEKGVRFGTVRKLTDEQITELKETRAAGVLIKTLMKDYGLSKASVYRYLETPAGSTSK